MKKEDKKPLLLTSFSPYDFFVKNIAGNDFTVQPLVPKDKNPHTFEVTAREIALLKKAKIWFYIGESFEKKIKPAIKQSRKDLKILLLLKNNELLLNHCPHCDKDTHLWLSPKRVISQASLIKDTLDQLYPQKKELFEKNYKDFLEKLKDLDAYFEKVLPKEKILLVSHAAFSYFCKDYSMVQIPLEEKGNPLSAKKLQKILDLIKERKIPFILTQPQMNQFAAKKISNQANIPLVYVDLFAENYFQNMKNIADTIQKYYE